MGVSQSPPETGMGHPSPVESADAVDSTIRLATERTAKPEPEPEPEPEDVMITLSLASEPPQPTGNRLPFSRSHLRSRSLAEVSGGPPMTRAYSSPGLDSRGRYIFVNKNGTMPPPNPAESAAKRYAPLQITTGDNLEAKMVSLNISKNISDQAEPGQSNSQSEPRPQSPVLLPFPRISRRRPSSPLQFASTPSSSQPVGTPPSTASPMILSRYNESYPGLSTPSASSMPSTPSSMRSRSPSISSLETIPDIPDAEDAALEADRTAALKAAADTADEAEASNLGTRRRGASDVLNTSHSLAVPRAGSIGYLRADKRKRWSVCGAERRQDLDLETIWED
ncbi:hypothetical protein PHISCL_08978 [Aspergillus sclerotialis]|uniref:Basic proline-rich protein n=1 Tax=Aspergillus sclerotialis TaxID=2070753 RepID=A0A3A2Z7S8_9EURO|nr:hypothetical protein PHISCL_08978 [Aspergillus sclerotialis]